MRRYEVQLDLRSNPDFMRTHRKFFTRYFARRFTERMIRSTTQFSVYLYDRKEQRFLVAHA